MFAVEVRDHIMIAHSLKGDVFGPAQALHGATFVVDVAFLRETLSADNIVVDMGRAQEVLKSVLGPLNYANLDEVFPGEVTTTEFLCRHIHGAIAKAAAEGALGPGSEGLSALRITLNESHVAKAWYEAAL
ncbi:6-pyruvoyl trahydropterin synthase family protein [Roseobacter sp. HKCCA0434]|uniref:6-pyruvoyl trahydropterin synthase family protein n=1 Tax=Roseobacter sp. HKCCA0434 TaxID=3079297 RepID=UPI002905A42A|nr:6-carboxytetrahydropterin synthase [Roseobacter sp. HKCCA0434]